MEEYTHEGQTVTIALDEYVSIRLELENMRTENSKKYFEIKRLQDKIAELENAET